MKKQLLAVCDSEPEYARRFCEYAAQKGGYPFETAAFGSAARLLEFCAREAMREGIDILLVSEDCYTEEMDAFVKGTVILLTEEEGGAGGKKGICRYQPCGDILKKILRICVEEGIVTGGYAGEERKKAGGEGGGRLRLIGLYTPVHRCLQTSFAIALGEILAKEHKTLYLNFESFSGLGIRLNREFMTDMSDLMYYVSNAREALCYKLKEMTETLQNLDYIPPVFSCMDLARITPEQWSDVFWELERQGGYEYLILDLSEGMQGLFEILRMCRKIFTLVREDSAARAKLCHYERLLERAEYEDILKKTRKCKLPLIRNLPPDLGELPYGELADYARKMVREEIYGE